MKKTKLTITLKFLRTHNSCEDECKEVVEFLGADYSADYAAWLASFADPDSTAARYAVGVAAAARKQKQMNIITGEIGGLRKKHEKN